MILDFIQKGGPVMWPLFGTALFAFYLIIYKCIHIIGLSLRYRNKSLIDQIRLHIKEKQYEQARQCIRHKGPKEKILLKGIECIEQDYSKDVMKERLEMIYEEEVHELDKGLPLILICGEIMPMLGLLGTVSGMINVFKAITVYGAGDTQALASGISEALLTTQVGLVLAIPTLFFYTLINARIESLTKLFNHVGAMMVTIRNIVQS